KPRFLYLTVSTISKLRLLVCQMHSQRLDSVSPNLKWRICLCYLDDIPLFSSSFEEHLYRLRVVLGALSRAGLQLNSKKCHFGMQEVKVLGHVVNAEGIHPDPEKIRVVADFPRPQNPKELQSF